MDMSPEAQPAPPRYSRKINPVAVLARMQANESVAKIARDLGVSKQGVYNALNVHRRKAKSGQPPKNPILQRSKVDLDEAKAMAGKGVTAKQIALYFGVSDKVMESLARANGFRWRDLQPKNITQRGEIAASAPPAPEDVPKRRVSVPHDLVAGVAPAPAAAPQLPQGYLADLLATKGKYAALEVWRKKYGPLVGRNMSATVALQEWHKYRGNW